MIIRFKENRASNISFYIDVESTFIPPHEIKEPDTRLKGFNWRKNEKPDLSEMLKAPTGVPRPLDTGEDHLPEPIGSQLD